MCSKLTHCNNLCVEVFACRVGAKPSRDHSHVLYSMLVEYDELVVVIRSDSYMYVCMYVCRERVNK